jgi:hypothetical protein
MADVSGTDNIDKTPLLKVKKPRPPQSEKQMENFKKMAETRAKNVIARKDERILTAQRALLEKEGYVKKGETQGQQQTQPIQFEIEEEEEEEEAPKKVAIKKTRQPKIKEIPTPKQVVRKRVPIIQEEEDEDDDGDSSSSEEVIIIKRSKKKKNIRQMRRNDEYEEDTTPPQQDFNSFFC